jgi:hypothetical protein
MVINLQGTWWKTCMRFSSPTCVLHALSSYPPLPDHPNNVWWGVQIVKLFITQFSPFLSMFRYIMQDPSYCTLSYIILFHITSTVILQCWRCHRHVHTVSVGGVTVMSIHSVLPVSILLNLFVMHCVYRAKEMLCNNALYPDLYGHYREAKFTQTKHHWWWKANRVFNQLEVTRNHTGMSVQPAVGYTQPHNLSVQPAVGYTQPHSMSVQQWTTIYSSCSPHPHTVIFAVSFILSQ